MNDFSNPYHPEHPVFDPKMFYGRDDALLWVEQQLVLGRRLLIMYGPDLIGKTSLALHLPTDLPAFIHRVNFECKPDGDRSLPELLGALTGQIAEQLSEQGFGPFPVADDSSDPVQAISFMIREATADASGDSKTETQQFLLILDDAHCLTREVDDEAEQQLEPNPLDLLTALLAATPALRLLLILTESAYHQFNHPLRTGAETLHIGPLNGDAAQQLITRPWLGITRFDPGAVKRIVDITSSHPYYLQLFCHDLFNRCAHEGWISQNDVDVVLEEILAHPNQRFQDMWDQSDPAERAALMAMSNLKGTHDLSLKQELIHYLQRFDEPVEPELILDALDRLADRGILARMGALGYRFVIKLFGYWLARHFDPARVISQIKWGRLSAQSASGKQSSAGRRRRWGFGHWVVIGLCITALTGLLLWGLVLTLSWPVSLADPTPVPVFSPESIAIVTPPATPTSTSIPPTPTPTKPVIVAQSMPSIAFRARSRNENEEPATWQVYVMNTDGTGRQRITHSNYEDITPAWSPDGQWITFVSKREDNRDIFIIPAPGTVPTVDGNPAQGRNLTQHPSSDWTQAWSPDGQQIVFTSNRAGYWEIFVVNPDGTGLAQVTGDGTGHLSPIWAPDGQSMAFSGKQDENWDIYVMPAPAPSQETDQEPKSRRLTVADGTDISPMFSPGGDMIAFESNRDGDPEIYVMKADGSSQRNISVSPSSSDQGPVWSPDGKQLLFYTNRDGNWEIYLTTIDGKQVTNLTNTPDIDEQEPIWRP